MASDSKILTVSYGTFSCTLEGFDDPFGTMKAIAEYFRDLAADDRYFGAEPPTPDPEMLARIAERQVNGRVEARQNAEGITLRRGGMLDAPDYDDRPDAAPAPAAAPPTPAADSVAARLARIRAAAEARPAPAPAAPEPAAMPVAAEQPAGSGAPESAASETAEADIAEPATEAPTAATAEKTQEPAQPTAPTAGADAETPAEERATAPEPAPPAAEEPAQASAGQGAEAQEPLRLDAPADIAADETAEAEPAAEDFKAAAQTDGAEEPAPAEEAEKEEAARAEATEEEETSQAEEDTAAEASAADQRQDRGARARDAAARARARALKIGGAPEPEPEAAAETANRTAAEAAAEASGSTDDRPAPPAETARPAAALSPEAEADLEAELAALENEGGVHSIPTTAHDRAAALTAETADDEAKVSRLVGEVNSALDAPEQRRRRVSLAHMKAAVAATLAERGGRRQRRKEDEASEDHEARPYRADLAEMVAPRSSRGSASEARRMPPLMLVSSQRIDSAPAPEAGAAPESTGNLALDTSPAAAPAAEEAGNIFADSEDEAGDRESFADFAARIEASGLDALIEAAAAHAIAIRGQDHFTRPQVMQAVSAHLGGGFPREDALRSFGRMLREGPFSRLRRGEFTLDEESVYMKKARG